jgi:hypothetical protein
MSTSHDNPNQACQPVAPCPQPAASPAGEDRGPDVPPRPPKAALLPEIARLSLEGHSSRAIGRRLGVPRRTVDRWLRQLRQQWADNAAKNAAELFAIAMARLESVYREAMEAWRRSLADKQVTVETPGHDGTAKAKNSLRTTTQSGQAALLGKAIQAAREIYRFNARHLEALSEAQAADRHSTRRGLAEELYALPKESFLDIKDLVREEDGPVPRHSPDELAEILSNLPAAEYRELRGMLWLEYGRVLPVRRGTEAAVEVDDGPQQ